MLEILLDVWVYFSKNYSTSVPLTQLFIVILHKKKGVYLNTIFSYFLQNNKNARQKVTEEGALLRDTKDVTMSSKSNDDLKVDI